MYSFLIIRGEYVINKVILLKEKSKKYFDKQSINYFNTFDGKFCSLMYKEVIQRIKERPFKSILDVGCGTGAMLSLLVSEFKEIQAYGLDFSEKMIEKSAALLGQSAHLVVGDSEHLPWSDNFFDLVVCNASFHHFPDPLKVLGETRRVLKSNGRIIIGEPWWSAPKRLLINFCLGSPFNFSGDVRIYSEAEMRDLLTECGYSSIVWELIDKRFSIATALAKN